jgi:hypothetical protein
MGRLQRGLPKMLFQPDLFSMSRPGWSKLDPAMLSTLDKALSLLPYSCRHLQSAPKQSDALGINSNNFRLNTSEGDFVLKHWSPQVVFHDVLKVLDIMDWLAKLHLPVPSPVKLQHKSFTISTDSGAWSLFPFVEGTYFSGEGDELYAAAEITGRLMEVLTQLPSSCIPNIGPSQLTSADAQLLGRVKDVYRTWDVLFGKEHANLLSVSWPLLMAEWENLNSIILEGGRIQAAHFDLHPHNLLFSGCQIAAVLDFEACKLMPVGFALGFAALKQCRQAMTLGPTSMDPRWVGSSYAKQLLRACPGAPKLTVQLGDLAVAEVLRRICIILRLNLESGEKKWNKVLGIQLGHLSEARALFG